MATYMAKSGELPRPWFLVDATNQVVGRLAVQIETVLRGKHRPEHTPHIDTAASVTVIHAPRGRRKGWGGRVRLSEGRGERVSNGRELDDYFTEEKDRAAVLGPLELTEMRNRLDVFIRVEGGGFTGQGGAICQGVARALKTMFGLPTHASKEETVRSRLAKKRRQPGSLHR